VCLELVSSILEASFLVASLAPSITSWLTSIVSSQLLKHGEDPTEYRTIMVLRLPVLPFPVDVIPDLLYLAVTNNAMSNFE
jgi:hypothetical protein